MVTDPDRVKEIFLEATELPDESARAVYLDRACEGDAELRDRVETLLRSHDLDGSFLGTPAFQLPEPNGATQELGDAGTQPPKDQTVALNAEGADAMADHKKTDDNDDDLQFLTPSTRPDSLGRLGHYEMLQVLGRGGFGIVFRAFDDTLQRVVAIKVMAPQIATLSPARKRFVREAQSSAKVRHENVVQVYEVGEQPLPYLAMEFIPGETLQQKLDRSGPLEVSEILRIGRQIAEGLAAAHACDLIHRDIKPGNILLEGGSHKAKITDFGLARAADDASISQSGIIAGTPMFMAPEQALGHHIDQRADLFSLGSVLYQMASGRPPFRAPSALAVLKRVAEEPPRPIPEIIPETPDWLCGIIAKLHAKNPADRFQSAREVADLLADCEAKLKAKQEVKNVLPASPSAVKPAGRKWVAAAAVLLLPVIALAVTEFAGLTHLFREQQPRPDPIKSDIVPAPIVAAQKTPDTPEGVGPAIVHGVITNDAGIPFHRAHVYLTTETNGAAYTGLTPRAYTDEQGRYTITTNDPKNCRGIIVTPPRGSGYEYSERMLSLKKGDKLQANFGLFASRSVTIEYVYQPNGTRSFKEGTKRGTILLERPKFGIIFSQGVAHATSTPDDLRFEAKDGQWQFRNFHVSSVKKSGFYDAGAVPLDGVVEAAETGYTTSAKPSVVGHTYVVRTLKGHYAKFIVKSIGAPSPAAKTPPVAKQELLPPTFKNGIGMEFVIVPKGKSWLGGGKDKLGDKEVEIPADFYLGKYEVTEEEWEKVMGENPSHFSRTGEGMDAVKDINDADLKRFPVENVSWDQCQIFVAKLNKLEKESGWVYRLPKEAEWEYACRGGPMADKLDSAFDFYFGKPTNTLLPERANFNSVLKRTRKVGSYEPNSLGLHDMHGNVHEWCDDLVATADGASHRVLRGGRWLSDSWDSRAAYRDTGPPSGGINHIGLRLARVPVGAPSPEVKTPPTAIAPFTDVDVKRIAALPAAEQVVEVRKELMRRNPDFDGKVQHQIENGVVTEWRVNTDLVTDISPIQVFNALQVLDCSGTYDNGTPKGQLADLAPLKGMNLAGLRELHLTFTKVSGAGLALFKDCKDLEHLSLSGEEVSDAGLANFKGCNRVKSLFLAGDQLTDAGVACFKDCNLVHIWVQGPLVTDAGLAHLKVDDLKQLRLPGTQVTDAGLARFKGRDLENLELHYTQVSDVGLAEFKGCKNLIRLNLAHCERVSDAGLAHFKDSKNVEQLLLDNTPITNAGLTHLAGLDKLTELNLAKTQVTAKGVEDLAKALPKCKIAWDGGVIGPN